MDYSGILDLACAFEMESEMSPPDRQEQSIRVAVADVKEQPRRALKAFLSTFQDIEVIAEAATAHDAVIMAGESHPEVILMCDLLPAESSIEATMQIKQRWPEIVVLVMTLHEEFTHEAEAAGADAFLVKGTSSDELVSLIRKFAQKTGHRVR